MAHNSSLPRRRRSHSFALLTVLLIISGAHPASAATYAVVDFGSLSEGGSVVVRGLNDAGQVVGSGRFPNGSRAFLLTRGALVPLGVGNTSDYSIAYGINVSGVVVGTLNRPSGIRGFLWASTTGIRELSPLPGDTSSAAFAINASGEAVGFSAGAAGTRAVRWPAVTGTPIILAAAGAPSESQALAINNAGVAVGVASNRAVSWAGATVTELGPLRPGDPSEALSVNSTGRAVGSSGQPAARRAVLWDRGGPPRDLGVLPGGTASRALAVNDANQIVGTSSSVLGNRAVIWSGTMSTPQDLNDMISGANGVVITQAVAINNTGAIVALGHDATGADHAHDGHEAHEMPVRVLLLVPAP